MSGFAGFGSRSQELGFRFKRSRGSIFEAYWWDSDRVLVGAPRVAS